jgi:membrane associated rhomboid family serine protease
MQPTFAIIPTRSERQAMDWSLVLVSQGIDASIERDPEANTWRLIIHAPDFPRAVQAISQYRRENRHQTWRRELPWTGLIFDWRSLAWFVFLVLLYAIEATGHGNLSAVGVMDSKAVHAGEWWRLVTAVTLHADLPHLAANATTGLVLLGVAMGTQGPGIGLLTSFLAGVGGNLAGLLFYSGRHFGLGASGMIMGALGLLSAQWLALLRHGITPRQLAVRGVLSGCLLLVLLGLSPRENVDVLAHVVGFVSGLAFGAVLALCPPRLLQRAWVNGTAVALCTALVAVSWRLALR